MYSANNNNTMSLALVSLSSTDVNCIVQTSINDFLDSNKLQRKIKETMQGDFFSNLIIEQLNSYILNEKITTKVDAALTSNKLNPKIDERLDIKLSKELKYLIPTEVNTHLDKNLNSMVQKHGENYLRLNLALMVLEQIKKELPTVMANDYYMNQVLTNHASALNAQLEITARAYLAAVTDEDQYHLINEQYFNSFDARATTHISTFEDKGNRAIGAIKSEASNVLKNINHRSEEKMQSINRDYSNKTNDLKKCIEVNNNLATSLTKLNKEHDSFVKFTNGVFIAQALFCCAALYLYLNK